MATGQGWGAAPWGSGAWGAGSSTAQLITFTGVASSEAFGALSLESGADIVFTGIASSQAFGSPTLLRGLLITVAGVASTETFGSLDVFPGTPISVPGITSAEAFGTLRLLAGTDILVGGIASAEAFGALRLNRTIRFTGIGSLEAFGAMRVQRVIRPLPIGSLEAFGHLVLGNEGIAIRGIPSREAFGLLVLSDFGRLRIVDGGGGAVLSGVVDGGTAVTLFGAVLDTDGCSDALLSGLGSSWSESSTGSGAVSARLGRGVVLDPGTATGGSATLARVGTLGTFDASIDVSRLAGVSGTISWTVTSAAGDTFGLSVLVGAGVGGGDVLSVFATLGGQTVVSGRAALSGGVSGAYTVRLVRVGARALALIGDQVYVDAVWTDAPVALSLSVARGTGTGPDARLVLLADNYVRRPVVLFGDQIALVSLLRSGPVDIVLTPPAAGLLPGPVTLSAVGCTGPSTAVLPFTYVLGGREVVGQAYVDGQLATATVLNDLLGGGGNS